MTFPTRPEYETLIYGLPEAHPEILNSTLHLYSTSALTAIVEGQIQLKSGLVLHILEVLDFKERRIQNYSYAIYQGTEKIRWYDPQPHPENSALKVTFPHHYHQEPDIKHNRQPAPGISFDSPNLSTVITDCVALSRVI
jgi:hypothetical protein